MANRVNSYSILQGFPRKAKNLTVDGGLQTRRSRLKAIVNLFGGYQFCTSLTPATGEAVKQHNADRLDQITF